MPALATGQPQGASPCPWLPSAHRSRHGNYLGPEPQMGSHDLPSPCCLPHPHCPELPQHGPAVLRHASAGLSYALWTGLGSIGVAVGGMLFFQTASPSPAGRLQAADTGAASAPASAARRGPSRTDPPSPQGAQGPVPGRKRGLAVHGAGPLRATARGRKRRGRAEP